MRRRDGHRDDHGRRHRRTARATTCRRLGDIGAEEPAYDQVAFTLPEGATEQTTRNVRFLEVSASHELR
jgi:hypothetical protein